MHVTILGPHGAVRRVSRVGLALFLFAVLAACGCRSLPFPRRKAPLPPLATDKLLDGDVFLTRSPSAFSAVFAWHPRFKGPYSHAALFYRRPGDGKSMLLHISGRLSVSPLEETLPRFARVRVLRHRRVGSDRNPLRGVIIPYDSRECRERVPSLFDPQNRRREAGDRGGYTCVAFANTVYEKAGLDPPFAPGLSDPIGAFLDWYAGKPGTTAGRQVSPNSPLYNPHFRTVLTWRNPRVSDKWLDTTDAIVSAGAEKLRQGYEFRPPPVSSRTWFGLLAALGRLSDIERRLGTLRIQYMRLVMRVLRELDRRKLHGHPLPADREERRKAVCEIFDAVFTEYMVLPEHPVRRAFE